MAGDGGKQLLFGLGADVADEALNPVVSRPEKTLGEQPVIRGLHQRRGVAGLGDLAGQEALEMLLIGRSQRTEAEMPAD